MITLDLVNPYASDIKFEHRQYPEGQQDIILKSRPHQSALLIKSRFNNWRDLELIICATKAARNWGVKEIHLFCPYMLGARSDRKFQDGGTSYLRDVVAPVINSLNFETVTVYDPHSDGVENTINNIVKIDNTELVQFALEKTKPEALFLEEYKYILISPDAGAQKKIYNLATNIGAKNVITASKHREISTGKILSTEVSIPEGLKNLDCFITDDIIDGGRTFIELSKALKNNEVLGKIYLIVTHGIFSAGYNELEQNFEKIFTTNSVKDIKNNNLINQINIY